jgi:hypothetical protein
MGQFQGDIPKILCCNQLKTTCNTHYSKSRTKRAALKLLKSSKKQGKEKYEKEHGSCPPKMSAAITIILVQFEYHSM